MIKKVLIILTLLINLYSQFAKYDITYNTNTNGDVTNVTLDWQEFYKICDELLEYKANKKNSIKKNTRNIIIITITSLITGFVIGNQTKQ